MRRLVLIALIALPLSADPIADVRAALGRLRAQEPIRATYELQNTVVSEGKLDNDQYAGKVAVELEGDAGGFRVVFPRPLLDTLEREQMARAKNPNLDMATVSALREIDPVDTADAIDFAPTLLRMLDGSKLVSDAAGTWQGKPARVLVIRVPDRLDTDDAKRVKMLENRLTLWLGADMVPLAAEHILQAKFSILILKAESKQKKSWHLGRAADRLVRLRYEEHRVSSGLGQKGNETVVATLRVH